MDQGPQASGHRSRFSLYLNPMNDDQIKNDNATDYDPTDVSSLTISKSKTQHVRKNTLTFFSEFKKCVRINSPTNKK